MKREEEGEGFHTDEAEPANEGEGGHWPAVAVTSTRKEIGPVLTQGTGLCLSESSRSLCSTDFNKINLFIEGFSTSRLGLGQG